ncbi:hypothetical protein DFH28DRAFT_1177070, partial [Melampsora americana]
MFSTINPQTEFVSSNNSKLDSIPADISSTRLSFLESDDATLTWLRANQLTRDAQRVFSEPNSHRAASIQHLRVRSCPGPNLKISHSCLLICGSCFSSVSQNDDDSQEIQSDHISGPQGAIQLVEYVVPFPSSDLAWPNHHGIEYHPSDDELDSTCSSSVRSPVTTLELGTPSSHTFFDPDVSFSPPQASLNCPKDSGLANEAVWEDRSDLRISRMVEKESRDSIQNLSSKSCRLSPEVRHEVVDWFLNFDLRLARYPRIAPSTRHRAITLFTTFWTQDPFSGSMLLEDIRMIARRTAVVCLILACKVDIDCLRPLFAVRLELWVKRVLASGWVPVDAQCLASHERTILRQLSYNVTTPTPFDFLSELTIASFELMRLVNHFPEDWELIEGAFKIILERTVQSPEYIKYPTSVIAAAALFLSLEGCLFDHPLEHNVVKGRHWSRDSDGTWTESIHPDVPKTVRVHMFSEVLCEMLVEVVQEDIKLSVCDLLDLDEGEVEECQTWCASL